MDSRAPHDTGDVENSHVVNAVLAEVTCAWGDKNRPSGQTTAVVVHSGQGMLVLEATDPGLTLPPIGTAMRVTSETEDVTGRLAEHGRGGRFLVAVGERPVRLALRLKVSLAGTVRSPRLPEPVRVEVVDLTTGGARLRGVELPVGSQVTLDFIPPGRDESVSVRAVVAHGTHRGLQPWIGVQFRLVAMRGGR
jgi:hypothetical protein